MKHICPEVLIISSKHDYSTDHIAYQLNKSGVSYLRLNRDQLRNFSVVFFPIEQILIGKTNSLTFKITAEYLKSVYFRAPIYLKDNYKPNLSADEQLARNQWVAFIKSLMVFKEAMWVNNPQATYLAEVKPYQLYLAHKIGFLIPKTIIANGTIENNSNFSRNDKIVVKTLEPAILKLNDKQAFIYSNVIDFEELIQSDISTAPIIIQEALLPKVDIRVTIVDDLFFSVDITKDGVGLDKDWRLEKDSVKYREIDLPESISTKCIELARRLGLKFGAIDLLSHKDEYYFIEINPTGEWSWLMEHTNLEIDKAITNLLLKGRKNVG